MKFLKRLLASAVIALTAQSAIAQDRPTVITVNNALQYFADRLVGDTAEVVFPVPQGVDPSFWRPSISDISMVQSADLILLNGAGFATWIDRVSLPRARLVNTTSAVEDQFIITESITHAHGDGGEHSHEGLASYTWLDPMLAIAQAEAAASAVIARDLSPAADVEANLEALRADLTALEASAQNDLAALRGVPIIATHPRYQYFARRFGLSITSLEWEAGAMPTPEQFAELEALATDLGASILIWEAAPPSEATEAAQALDLTNVVFAPWAGQGAGDTFIADFSQAVSDLSAAAQ